MFQTQIILYLQSFASNGLTILVRALTDLGDEKMLAGIIILITFGISYRKGLLIMQTFQWTLMLNIGFKNLFALPRPTYVQGDIQNLQHSYFDQTPFNSTGADKFLGPIDPQVVKSFRSQNSSDYGFPSGHTSAATALWGGIAMAFRNKSLCWLAIIISLLVGLSRMYLGRHFLGDVIGGLALAGIILFFSNLIFFKGNYQYLLFERETFSLKAGMTNLLTYSFMFILPFCLTLYSADIFGEEAGYLIGANSALLLVLSKGMPKESGTLLQRVFRVLLGAILFFTMKEIMGGVIERFNLGEIGFFEDFLAAAIPTFTSFAGTILVGYKIKLYQKQTPTPIPDKS